MIRIFVKRIFYYYLNITLLFGLFLTSCATKTAKIKLPIETPAQVNSVSGYDSLHMRINVPERKLYLLDRSKIVKEFPIAVGQARYPTPIQEYTIEQIVWNPWWIPPESDWAKDAQKTPPGPGNPLGTVKMIMQEAIMIHGTNKPGSIGSPASHGCIRMYKQDAEDLAWFVQKYFSDKTDESLRAIYKSKNRQSFYVNLNRSVPVSIVYETTEIIEGNLMVYQDIYNKNGDLKGYLESYLAQRTQKDISIRLELLNQIKSMLKSGKAVIPLQDILSKLTLTASNS